MRKIREILRLHEAALSQRQISQALRVSRPVVADYLAKLKKAGLKSGDIAGKTDSELQRLFTGERPLSQRREGMEKLFEEIATELRRRGVTLELLWCEYVANSAEQHYSYSTFCKLYRRWSKDSELDMHMQHAAGDKTFVDFTGAKLALTNLITGEITDVEVFVAILGASQLTYAEATPSQKKEDFIRANVNAFAYFGGVTKAIVPDCLKSAVTNGNKYEPEINQEFADFSLHYDTVVLPARPHHPKDKALVENAVRLTYQRIFAPMRDEIFSNLNELNARIRELLDKHNDTPMQKLKLSRRQLFMDVEKSSLKPLPAERYETRKFATATVQMNYHLYFKEDSHYYSVPFRLRGQQIRIIYTESTVEIFHDNRRVALHPRDRKPNSYTTNKEHMPSHHRFVAEWNPERIVSWAQEKGEHVGALCLQIMKRSQHAEQGFKSAIGVISLTKKYGSSRVNAACRRALRFSLYSYRGVKNILENGLDSVPLEEPLFATLPNHENVRGKEYYATTGE